MNKKITKTIKSDIKTTTLFDTKKDTPYNLPSRSIHENPTPPFSVRTMN